MDLRVQSITYQNFRNYESFTLDNLGDLIILVGPNAVGKTNLLEGLQLTTALTSFRNPKTEYLVRFGSDAARVTTSLTDGSRQLDLTFSITENKRTYQLNGKRKKAQELRGLLPAIVFTPDNLRLIKGAHSLKRTELDSLGAQLSKNYATVVKDYEKIIRQKNSYLKNDVSHSYLAAINEVVAQIGAQLYVLRLRLLQELVPYIQQAYLSFTHQDEQVDITYIPSWLKHSYPDDAIHTIENYSKTEAQECLIQAMDEYSFQEHARHCSLYGPHADHINFFINGKNAQQFASQGQQRSLVLSYKIAEVALIHDKLNQKPVLLLDDVMSELDEQRRAAFMDYLSNSVQTFITTTNLSYFSRDVLKRACIVTLEHK